MRPPAYGVRSAAHSGPPTAGRRQSACPAAQTYLGRQLGCTEDRLPRTQTKWIAFANGSATGPAGPCAIAALCRYPSPVPSKPGATEVTQSSLTRPCSAPVSGYAVCYLSARRVWRDGKERRWRNQAGMAGAMRSVGEGSVASSLLNTGAVPLEQMPALAAAVLERRTLPGPSNTAFSSSI